MLYKLVIEFDTKSNTLRYILKDTATAKRNIDNKNAFNVEIENVISKYKDIVRFKNVKKKDCY